MDINIFFHIISLKFDFRFPIIFYMPDNQEIMTDVLSVFEWDFDCLNPKLRVKWDHKNTLQLNSKVQTLIKKYQNNQKIVIIFYKINDFLKKLEKNEPFIVLPSPIPKDSPEMVQIGKMLLQEQKHPFAQYIDEFGPILEQIQKSYRIFDTSTILKKKCFGEPDKSKRRCRFCGKTQRENVTFHKEAHAISKALGNDKFILNEECDDCNQKFGNSIEVDIINFFEAERFYFSITGRKSQPSIATMDFKVTGNDGNLSFDSDNDCYRKLSTSKKHFIPQNVYRALCKFALSTVDLQFIEPCNETIKWINNECDKDKLPLILIGNMNAPLDTSLNVYIRKNDNIELPYMIGEFYLGNKVLVFIVPFVDKDELGFIEEKQIKKWKDLFVPKHREMTLRDFSSLNNWHQAFALFPNSSVSEGLGKD